MYCRIIIAVKCRMQWVTFVFVPCFCSLEVTKEESRIKERKILKKTEFEKFKLHYLAFRSRNEVSWFFCFIFHSIFSAGAPTRRHHHMRQSIALLWHWHICMHRVFRLFSAFYCFSICDSRAMSETASWESGFAIHNKSPNKKKSRPNPQIFVVAAS